MKQQERQQSASEKEQRILDEFFQRVAEAPCRVLFLDYDGTLAPFRENRHEAVPAPGVGERLNRLLEEGSTRVIIVSGRPVADVLKLSRPQHPVEVWGCHGREHLYPGDETPRIIGVSESQQEALRQVEEQARSIIPAEKIEVKTGCVAFHWRGLEDDERQRLEDDLRALCESTARRQGMEVRPFDGGLELAVPGRSKGHVINTVLESLEPAQAEAQVEGDGQRPKPSPRKSGHPEGPLPRPAGALRSFPCAVAFLGDDLTDEDGFRALGDRGLSVLVRNQPRSTEADLRIGMPGDLLQFLDRWIDSAPHSSSASAKE